MATHERHTHPTGRVHFHPWGLSRDDRSHRKQCGGSGISGGGGGGGGIAAVSDTLEARRFVGGTYGNLTGPLYSLDRIVRKLGHGGRRIEHALTR